MSQITNKDVKKIAKLARIELDEADCDYMAQQLTKTISWIEELNEVNTDNVEPLFNIHNSQIIAVKDEISDGNIAQDVIKNSKNSKYGYFAVPKVIE